MITLSDSYRTLEFKNHFVILPSTKLWDEEKYRAKNKKDIGIFNKKAFSYNSQNNKWFLSVQEIQNLKFKSSKSQTQKFKSHFQVKIEYSFTSPILNSTN